MLRVVLNEDQNMIRDLARDLAQKELKPRSEEVDREAAYPLEGVSLLAEAGLVACMIPEELGGSGLDSWSQTAVLEEAAKECASTAWAVANIAEVAACVLSHGTQSQKETVLPQLAAGTCAAAAGSDGFPGGPFRLTATAEPAEGGYVLKGVKRYVPNAGRCGWYLVAAQAGEQVKWFLLSGMQVGLRTEERPQNLGLKGCAVGDLILEQCIVSGDMAVEGDVLSTLSPLQALDMASIGAGLAQGALQEAIQYVNQRVQFGKTIAQFENTQHTMAELLAKTHGARALVWEAAQVRDGGGDWSYAAALAKLAAADAACVVTRKCVQFMGGYGYSREYPVERKMRDAKMTELYGGISSFQKDLAAACAVVQS